MPDLFNCPNCGNQTFVVEQLVNVIEQGWRVNVRYIKIRARENNEVLYRCGFCNTRYDSEGNAFRDGLWVKQL